MTLSLLVAALVCSALGNGVWTYLENPAGYPVGGLADVFYAANALLTIVAVAAAGPAGRRRNLRAGHRLTDDLAGASAYITSILPAGLSGPVEVRSRYLPSRAIGGDCFGYN